MTVDELVALSLDEELPRRELTARLLADDPALLERARALLPRATESRTRALELGIGFLPWSDPAFPAGLLAIPDCPPGLWFRGGIEALSSPLVAIVGSRAGSAVALQTSSHLGQELAARGVTVVSGLARGVDSAAHLGALRAGRTVAVLGSGLNHVYPPEHSGLADGIAASGALVTEYPPDSPPLPFHFPLRNRIISGLSRAVIVIEASEKSGSLITASCALEQGREVMAVPGNVLSGRNRGGHALIRDGAKIVECADDVLAELGIVGTTPESPLTSCGQSPSGNSLLSKMEVGCPYDLDALVAASGVDASRLLPRLCDLELDGRIRRVDGGRFVRTA